MSLMIDKTDILNCKKDLEKKIEAYGNEDDTVRDRKAENKEKEKFTKMISSLSKKYIFFFSID